MSGEPGASNGDARPPAADVPDRLITLALEFAVGIAAAGAKLRAPLAFPVALKPLLKFQKLPASALAKVRAAVEGDDAFRRKLARAAAAAPELLDDASMLWLTRPEGWEQQLAALMGEADPNDLAAELRRSERRREAAESAAHRVLAESVALRAELERRTDVSTTATQEIERLKKEAATARLEVERHQAAMRKVNDQLQAARNELAELTAARDAALARAADAERLRDEVLAARAAAGPAAAAAHSTERAVLAGAAAVADELDAQSRLARQLMGDLDRLARRLHHLEPAARTPNVPERPVSRRKQSGRSSQRQPIGVPGGLYGSSLAAAEHVVRHPGAVVFVDGYNVAKLRFPLLELEAQRAKCIDLCEDVARRWGTNIVVVFDGTNGLGIAATVRRLVRVTFSPEGVIADDVIRREVASLPDDVPVVVVTNDQAVIADVRAMGANPVSSDRWIELATR